MSANGVISVTVYEVAAVGPFIELVVESTGKLAEHLGEWPVVDFRQGRWVDGVGFALKDEDREPGDPLWEHEYEHVGQAAAMPGFAQMEFEIVASYGAGCFIGFFLPGGCYKNSPMENAARKAADERSQPGNATDATVTAMTARGSLPVSFGGREYRYDHDAVIE